MSNFWFQDFAPRRTRKAGILRFAEYEPFENTVLEANRWIEEHQVDVVSMETVVLPNIWSEHEEGTTDSSLGTRGNIPSHWHQFLRVWYRGERETPPEDAAPAPPSEA